MDTLKQFETLYIAAQSKRPITQSLNTRITNRTLSQGEMELTQEEELVHSSWKKYLGSSVEKFGFFVFALGMIVATKFCWEKMKRKNLPPGPWGLPVIGK